MNLELPTPTVCGEKIIVVTARADCMIPKGSVVGLPKAMGATRDPDGAIKLFPLQLCSQNHDPLGVSLEDGASGRLFWLMQRGPVSVRSSVEVSDEPE